MPTVTLILGYCGSGKTPLANEMEESGCRKFDEGFLDNEADYADLTAALRVGIDCVVVEVWFCIEQNRERFKARLLGEFPAVKIECIWFEANIQKANQNCRTRTNKAGDPGGTRHIEINERIGSSYQIPPGIIPRPIKVGP